MTIRLIFWVTLLSMVPLVSTADRVLGETAAVIPAEAFFSNPTMCQPKISPDGKNLAFVFSKGDTQRLFVRPVASSEAVGLVEFRMEEVRLHGFMWANSSRLLLNEVAPEPGAAKLQPLVTRLYAVDRERPRSKWLGDRWPARSLDWPARQVRFEDKVISLLESDPKHVLISHLEGNHKTPSVSRLNAYSGRLRQIHPATRGVGQWHADPNGNVRAGEALRRSGGGGKSYTLLARSAADQKLAPVVEAADHSQHRYRFAGFHEDPNLLYMLADHEGRDALYEFDIAAGALGSLVFAHPFVDVTGAHYSETYGRVVGAEYVVDEPEVDYFDEVARREHRLLDRSLRTDQSGGSTNRIVSIDQEGRLAIIEVSSHVQPPVYYAYDRTKREINFIFEKWPAVPHEQLAPVERIDFAARDGVDISGYLTVPRGVAPTKLPMIVLPHGGPAERSAKVYDPVVQFFANRGFAVLQVNFRGSSGFGAAFQSAGHLDGRLVSHDDIADAVKWVIAQGTADADRVGIFGVGYGGYSALMGLVTAPELYRAGASYAGITDLERLSADDSYWFPGLRMPGDVSVEQLRSESPLRRVEEIRAPVLLGHGKQDARVPVKHARRLAKALEAAGKTVEYTEYARERHGLSLERSRIDFYTRLLEFFQLQLAPAGAAPEAPAADSGDDEASAAPAAKDEQAAQAAGPAA